MPYSHLDSALVRGARALVVALVVVSTAESACAQAPFRLEKTREFAWLGAGVATGVTSLVLVAGVDPLTVDEINRLDPNDVNSFDREAIGTYQSVHTGDALAYASYLFPLATFVRDDTRRDWETIGVMWVEATALNLGINGVVKSTVLRTRPYVYDPDTPLDQKTTKSARLSFYSGHATSTACNCFFVARVFSEYIDSSRAKTILWASAAAYPVLAGVARVSTANHFRTDVIAGYVIGASIGYLVPHFHLAGDERVSLEPVSIDGDAGVGVRIAF